MKKGILICIGILSMSAIYSQDITDALRYSKDDIQGTARYRALSGAFGALGGDMSAVSINPAGSSIFNNNHISLSLSNLNSKSDIQYFNGFDDTSNSNVDLNQIGAAFIFKNRNEESDWKKFTLGVTYNKIEDYDSDWFAHGTNTSNSIDSYFLEYAQGQELFLFTPTNSELAQYFNISESSIANNDNLYYDLGYQFLGEVENLQQQQNFLGYNSYILEPETNINSNTVYTSNIADGNFNHEYSYVATGFNGKFTINGSTQYGDNLYFGINLNTHFINYERSTYLYESNDNDGSIVKAVGFENNLSTIGSGISIQIGGILKIVEQLRVGLTYDTPTWYTIEDESFQKITTTRDDSGTDITQIVNPQVLNIFPQYRLQSPGKLTGSLAYIFGNHGLISFDYSRKDYGNAKFRPTSDNYFSGQNNIISNSLTSASTYKIGGEFKIKQFSLRGGYRMEESPYKNGNTVGDLTGYSLGLGYNLGKLILDLTFDQSQRKINYEFYQVGLTDAANLDTKNSNITMSLSFNL